MTRIATNDVVMETIRPYVNTSSLARVNHIGHDVEFFADPDIHPFHEPLRIGYFTWKSDIGDRVASRLRGEGFVFRAVRGTATWEELRELYHWCDVFIAAPLAHEGFYLPALEAMASGTLVVTPDVVGNRSFCDFGTNCIQVPYEDEAAYADELIGLREHQLDSVTEMRAEGRTTALRFDLTAECEGFSSLLGELVPRVRRFEKQL